MAKTEWQLLDYKTAFRDTKLHLALRLRGSQKFLKEIFRQL
jgi:hypothetical protein